MNTLQLFALGESFLDFSVIGVIRSPNHELEYFLDYRYQHKPIALAQVNRQLVQFDNDILLFLCTAEANYYTVDCI